MPSLQAEACRQLQVGTYQARCPDKSHFVSMVGRVHRFNLALLAPDIGIGIWACNQFFGSKLLYVRTGLHFYPGISDAGCFKALWCLRFDDPRGKDTFWHSSSHVGPKDRCKDVQSCKTESFQFCYRSYWALPLNFYLG